MMHHGTDIYMLFALWNKQAVYFTISIRLIKVRMNIIADKTSPKFKTIIFGRCIFFQGDIKRRNMSRIMIHFLRICPFKMGIFTYNNFCNQINKMGSII